MTAVDLTNPRRTKMATNSGPHVTKAECRVVKLGVEKCYQVCLIKNVILELYHFLTGYTTYRLGST